MSAKARCVGKHCPREFVTRTDETFAKIRAGGGHRSAGTQRIYDRLRFEKFTVLLTVSFGICCAWIS